MEGTRGIEPPLTFLGSANGFAARGVHQHHCPLKVDFILIFVISQIKTLPIARHALLTTEFISEFYLDQQL